MNCGDSRVMEPHPLFYHKPTKFRGSSLHGSFISWLKLRPPTIFFQIKQPMFTTWPILANINKISTPLQASRVLFFNVYRPLHWPSKSPTVRRGCCWQTVPYNKGPSQKSPNEPDRSWTEPRKKPGVSQNSLTRSQLTELGVPVGIRSIFEFLDGALLSIEILRCFMTESLFHGLWKKLPT